MKQDILLSSTGDRGTKRSYNHYLQLEVEEETIKELKNKNNAKKLKWKNW